MGKKLYVGNLSYDVTKEDLEAFFGEFGEIVDVKLIIDRDTGRSKGFAFIEFANNDSAQAALAKNGEEWHKRRLKINEARQREGGGRPSGGGYQGKRY